MIEIALKDVEKFYGANHILKGVTCEIKQRDRVGLLGRNGAGKTTLFKIMAGTEKADAGNKMIRKGYVIGVLDQIPEFTQEFTAYDVLYSVFEDILNLRHRIQKL